MNCLQGRKLDVRLIYNEINHWPFSLNTHKLSKSVITVTIHISHLYVNWASWNKGVLFRFSGCSFSIGIVNPSCEFSPGFPPRVSRNDCGAAIRPKQLHIGGHGEEGKCRPSWVGMYCQCQEGLSDFSLCLGLTSRVFQRSCEVKLNFYFREDSS